MGWKEIVISKAYKSLFDGPHATPKPASAGNIFLRIENITDDGHLDFSNTTYISENDYPRWTKRVIPEEDDIVFSYEATLGRYAIIPKGFKGCLGRRIALIRPDNDKAFFKFLYYYFFSKPWKEEVNKYLISGATVDRIPLIKFPKFEIILPPLPIQRKIAAVLSAYDDLIENNNRRIAILEKMAEEIYREWFVRMRFPGHEKAKFHKGVPEEWKETPLREIANMVMGQSPKSEFYNTIGDGLPFNQGVGTYGNRFPRKETFCSVRGRLAEKGDILFSVRAPVGRLNIADSKMIIGRGLAALREKHHLDSYLFYLLKQCFQSEDVIGNGAIFNSVGKDELEAFKILYPGEGLAKAFNSLATSLDRQIENLTQSLGVVTRSRDLLLSRLITGKLSVENLDIKFPESMEKDEAEA